MMPTPRSAELTINWDRAIFIDQVIDDDLVRKLAPTILAFRQASESPITVAIDSGGGSLAALDVLIGLLTGPSQLGKYGSIITVATNKAYSAAATFLAFGTYSVALQHAQVLYHDVRWGGMEDVTPSKARDAAKALQDANDAFSLRLAHVVIRRLIWAYIDLRKSFDEVRDVFPTTHKKFTTIVSNFAPKLQGDHSVDIAGFAACLYARLSSANDSIITNVMDRLHRWIDFTRLAKATPTYRPKRSRTGGMLDGAAHLHKLLNGNPEHFQSSEEDLKLLLSLLTAELAKVKGRRVNFSSVLEKATREFSLFNSMNAPQHLGAASKLMLEHSHVFFGRDITAELEGKDEVAQGEILSKAAPYAQLFWHFCVLTCRELFEGEHVLKPKDAQVLGLIDEVAGGGPISTLREFHLEVERDSAAKVKKLLDVPSE
jgi:ATP-dependent protease ClpP protease subunit